MKIIEVRPSKKFRGSWMAFEAPGVAPTYTGSKAREHAIDYARCRFGGCPEGEIHVFDDAGANVVEVIKIDGGKQYGGAH